MSSHATQHPTVVIAGASGFIGQALGRALAADHHVIGLSRGEREKDAHFAAWRRCDLFSALDTDRALEGAHYAIYLVHSMMPSAQLTQGAFGDLDLICADNFARSAARAGVRQIVYLGGLVPEGQPLSPHLESRIEVERTLGAHGVPVTALRAGLVIGAGGSSFEMLTRLVHRLPAMLCPSWTATRMQPIALDDTIALLRYCLGREACFGQRFDIGSPDVVTYRELLALTAELMAKPRRLVTVPLMTVRLSRLWVSAVTGAPRALVEPLVESLEHEMIAADLRLQVMAGMPGLGVREAISRALAAAPAAAAESPLAFRGAASKSSDRRVRSVQRLSLPPGRDAAWAAEEYMAWLPRFFRGAIRVDIDKDGVCRFRLGTSGVELLQLKHAPERSRPDRQLFYVIGGALARSSQRGRFELRQVLDGRVLLAAIHDFEPELPWPIYNATQAPFHEEVMLAFGRHLRSDVTSGAT
jgi:uncharacterized protein YbjT (DUF2867 family)